MPPLEQLFRLESEFHRQLRTLAAGSTGDAASLHTSYALQCGYEPLIHSLGPIATQDVERLREHLTLTADPRDLLAARDSAPADSWASRLLDP